MYAKPHLSQGATWLQRQMQSLIGGTWFTGSTWMRSLAIPVVAAAMIGALLVPALAQPAAADDNPEIMFSSTSFQTDSKSTLTATSLSLSAADNDVALIPQGNLLNSSMQALRNLGITGQGVDVAIIDTGVAPVQGLDTPGKVFHGPDLSAEGAVENLATIDTYGHGTHLSGIIAGNDGTAGGFTGVAPDSRIVSLKIAGADGGTSVAQAVAAIEWVVEHKNSNGLNIRVLNLSFGVSNPGSAANDPLAAAVERAWDAGIVVVAAAGNQGNTSGTMDSPATSPYVIAVAGGNTGDGTGGVATWSSQGDGTRNPDVAAAGKSIYSLRVPGSTLDTLHPNARVGTRLTKGSGTSQAAAVMSGTVALVLSANPTLTPDEVKWLFMWSAWEVDAASTILDGEGLIRPHYVHHYENYRTYSTIQTHPRALGITDWSSVDSWAGGQWNGATWSGATWSGATWSGATWSGATWSGATWSGATWSGATWSGATWSGATWSGATWSGAVWTADGWINVGRATTEVPAGQSRASAYDSDGRLAAADAAAATEGQPTAEVSLGTSFFME